MRPSNHGKILQNTVRHARIARLKLFVSLPGISSAGRQRFRRRDMMKTLKNEEARRLLQTARVARLGCVVNGEPYVVPLNCHLEGDYLYSHSLPGRKITGLRENPKACVQVDEIESDLRWRSVIAFGRYEEITRSSERAEVLNKLLHKFSMLTPVESTIAMDGAAVEVIVFRIKIERLTGVSEG
jgi:nitroimidazol reductase NimA-like FMN-containing flavoprotein (pyridoxamine 5'-phosphate oxidase superfamily)